MQFEEDIIFSINEDIFEEIKICVDQASPNEACGLIFGDIVEKRKKDNGDNYQYHFISYKYECIKSTQKSPIAFLMDDYNKLIDIYNKYSKGLNLKLLSIFHSHPGSAYPSGVDLPYMENYYKSGIPKFKHIIWTIMDASNKDLNGFIYIFDELKQISIEIVKK